jgi:hypothetical protein
VRTTGSILIERIKGHLGPKFLKRKARLRIERINGDRFDSALARLHPSDQDPSLDPFDSPFDRFHPTDPGDRLDPRLRLS